MMARVIAFAKQYVSGNGVNGDYNNSDTPSIFGSPGSGGNVSGFYSNRIYIKLAIDENGGFWVAPGGGTVDAHFKIGSNRADWLPMMWANATNFNVTIPVGGSPQVPGSAKKVFEGHTDSGSSGGSQGSVWHTIPDSSDAVKGEEVPSGYVYMGDKMDFFWPETNEVGVYLSGIVWYGPPSNTPVTMNSAWVSITDTAITDEFLKYYPGERRISDEWWSANRDGSEQALTGTFRRISGSWAKMLNQNSDSAAQHGFVRKNGSWVKASKSGRGA